MNKLILEKIEKYSKDLNFQSNLEELIKSLNEKLEQVKNTPIKKVLDYSLELDLESKKQDLFKSILNQTIKNEFNSTESSIQWTNGHDNYCDMDVIKHNITYVLKNYKIIFKIEEVFNYSIIHGSINIDEIIKYTLIDHEGELGYYQQKGKAGLNYYNKQNAKKFHEEFDSNKIYESSKEFFRDFLQVLFDSILAEMSSEFEDKDYIYNQIYLDIDSLTDS